MKWTNEIEISSISDCPQVNNFINIDLINFELKTVHELNKQKRNIIHKWFSTQILGRLKLSNIIHLQYFLRTCLNRFYGTGFLFGLSSDEQLQLWIFDNQEPRQFTGLGTIYFRIFPPWSRNFLMWLKVLGFCFPLLFLNSSLCFSASEILKSKNTTQLYVEYMLPFCAYSVFF